MLNYFEKREKYIDCLVQNCGSSTVLAAELPQSCAELLTSLFSIISRWWNINTKGWFFFLINVFFQLIVNSVTPVCAWPSVDMDWSDCDYYYYYYYYCKSWIRLFGIWQLWLNSLNAESFDKSWTLWMLNHMIKTFDQHFDGLLQERRNSIANALESRLSCTNPSTC